MNKKKNVQTARRFWLVVMVVVAKAVMVKGNAFSEQKAAYRQSLDTWTENEEAKDTDGIAKPTIFRLFLGLFCV